MKREFFINNRKKLFNKLEDNSVLIMFAGDEVLRSEDENFAFTPNRNFYYLTGIDEPKDILVLTKINNQYDEFLMISRFDETKAKWLGKTYDENQIDQLGGFKKSIYLDEFDKTINDILNNNKIKNYYLDFGGMNENYPTNAAIRFKNNCLVGKNVIDVYPTIASLRLVKEDEEIEQIRHAIHITNIALTKTLEELKPGNNENDLDCMFAYQIHKNGASDFAFKTIVASGIHSCTLHYSVNKDELHDNEVCLFDLGAAYNYYSADISRTHPVNGKFNERQQTIYNIVLGAQNKVFEAAKPGISIKELNNIVIEYYKEELYKIGLIKEKTNEEVFKYYFHSVSHHLGLDTHDMASLRKEGLNNPLVKGNVITVEPGLYIEEEKIGVRIEDDILITDNGCEVLSKEIAK